MRVIFSHLCIIVAFIEVPGAGCQVIETAALACHVLEARELAQLEVRCIRGSRALN